MLSITSATALTVSSVLAQVHHADALGGPALLRDPLHRGARRWPIRADAARAHRPAVRPPRARGLVKLRIEAFGRAGGDQVRCSPSRPRSARPPARGRSPDPRRRRAGRRAAHPRRRSRLARAGAAPRTRAVGAVNNHERGHRRAAHPPARHPPGGPRRVTAPAVEPATPRPAPPGQAQTGPRQGDRHGRPQKIGHREMDAVPESWLVEPPVDDAPLRRRYSEVAAADGARPRPCSATSWRAAGSRSA